VEAPKLPHLAARPSRQRSIHQSTKEPSAMALGIEQPAPNRGANLGLLIAKATARSRPSPMPWLDNRRHLQPPLRCGAGRPPPAAARGNLGGDPARRAVQPEAWKRGQQAICRRRNPTRLSPSPNVHRQPGQQRPKGPLQQQQAAELPGPTNRAPVLLGKGRNDQAATHQNRAAGRSAAEPPCRGSAR